VCEREGGCFAKLAAILAWGWEVLHTAYTKHTVTQLPELPSFQLLSSPSYPAPAPPVTQPQLPQLPRPSSPSYPAPAPPVTQPQHPKLPKLPSVSFFSILDDCSDTTTTTFATALSFATTLFGPGTSGRDTAKNEGIVAAVVDVVVAVCCCCCR
jgi:hypothetical protein